MKSRASMVRLKIFQVRGRRREIAQLEMMIAEFERMVLELEAQIIHEERKSGNNDVHHFAYSAFARAARQRRDNLVNSIRDLQLQKTNAEIALHEANTELQRAQLLEAREKKATADDEGILIQSKSMTG
ncbi:multidrug resistance efflux pump [Bartonella callosciuri]|uniref:Multidrug resistance efflux pump n=1 Tax=Bartonella callosciuri TaxID=686223 RepID=A0A840NNX1_9HYPH|nr:flagellar export protein FliJ [Bartonella callosciuri]MBB5073244.1 multidrug resistance efflux pump [Bartonella callosciuri]